MTHIQTESEKDYNFEEMCPHCDEWIPIVIDDADMETYSITCPHCGRKMMLCTLCHWDANDLGHDELCDWREKLGCWRERGEKPWWEGEQFAVGTAKDCYLEIGIYGNSHVAIDVMSESEGLVTDLTTVLPETDQYPANFGFVDTNNCPEAPALIRCLRIGKYTGKMVCGYPLYEFDEEALKKWKEYKK